MSGTGCLSSPSRKASRGRPPTPGACGGGGLGVHASGRRCRATCRLGSRIDARHQRGGTFEERFAASDWNKPPVPRAGGGGRRLLGCQDRSCCPNGHNDTPRGPKGHYLRQRTKPLERLSRVAEGRRVDDFLKHDLDPAARIAETAAKLTSADAAATEMLQRTKERLTRSGPVLRDLQATMGDRPHAHAPARRGDRPAGARVARR